MLPTKEDKSVESFDVRVVEETGSTNDDMKTHARSSRVSRPLVLEAKHQTMGRGTRGRGWKSPEGCLAFSLLLPFSMIRVPVSLVAIAVGMGVCSALRDAGRFACIKWPNDVWFEGGKCGGILCESVKDADGRSVLIAGVGLNRDGAAERTTNGWPISGLGDVLACSDARASCDGNPRHSDPRQGGCGGRLALLRRLCRKNDPSRGRRWGVERT